ncbi:hypothetical protein ANCCEY_02782 [Ancylostoma ceylanicum]|uniref:Uncharacterized protein n=1 Tax=Ancylostoma ceylanicum TaxID=53326 RepID=A0A0D6MBY9_9BILA|nr:hypothetical protein ANCCEY_02782 [Ancylostoma ceylanicum]
MNKLTKSGCGLCAIETNLILCALTTLGIIARQHTTLVCNHGSLSKRYAEEPQSELSSQEVVEDDDLPFHPFENSCKFAMPNTYARDIAGDFRTGERLRQLQCPYENFDFATMDSEGYMYVHPHFTRYPNITTDVKCHVVFLEGALRNKLTNKGKDNFKEVAVVEAPENTRFLANGDAFYIRCYQKEKQIFQQVYAGIRDLEREPNRIYIAKDMESFDDYGRRQKIEKKSTPQRYSIDILGFDSTSRTMFLRHLPRTMETMNKLGYELLYGYNKVGDNSMVNVGPILAGDIPAALKEPKLDASGDINANWILPSDKKMDPTDLPLLWKMMKEKYGCRSMFNDDISMSSFGLFQYPRQEFLPGFTSSPADHFYRTYYLAVYKNWRYSQCKDGGQIQRQFVDLWRRFSNKYKDICHFGFTFVTTLTHEVGFVLETMDEQISSSLQNLYFTGALDKGISIIMGDHGNRIGLVQYKYTGRIEERMPLMAIRLPPDFKKLHPKEYSNFLVNKYKLTSNFDIHQTLKDIALMKYGSTRRSSTQNYGRGISLFDEIPANRSCFEAYIPENFCTCLIDRPGLSMPKEQEFRRQAVSVLKYTQAIQDWVNRNALSDCLRYRNMTVMDDVKVLGLNPLARHGLRSKQNVTLVNYARKKNPQMDFLYHEVVALLLLSLNDVPVRLLFRIEETVATNISHQKLQVNCEKYVLNPLEH